MPGLPARKLTCSRRAAIPIVLGMVWAWTALLTACIPAGPPASPQVEYEVQTRVAATLTAIDRAPSPAASPTPMATLTEVQAGSPTATDTATAATAEPPSNAPTATATPTTAIPTPTPSPTEPPAPADTPAPTDTPMPTDTPLPTHTPVPTDTPLPTITDWAGEYYATRDLSGLPALVRNDQAIRFDWGTGAPASGLPSDNFAARWTRYLDLEGATWRFEVTCDDGARLWVDDELIIDAWYNSSKHTVSEQRPLLRGKHKIQLDYYEHTGDALVELRWYKVEDFADWEGAYWDNPDLNGSPVLIRNDPHIDFDWGVGPADEGLPADNFSARWTRTVELDAATYRFYAFVDDGVRLWVDDQLIIDAWQDGQPRELTAERALAMGPHPLRIEYYERGGGAQVRVWWEAITSPTYVDWKGEYWSNLSFSGSPVLVRDDVAIEFDWGTGAPAPDLPEDDFSVRWSRQVEFETGIYRFRVWVDDGIRFYVDADPIVDEWHDSQGDRVYVADVTLYGEKELVVDYYERSGDARIKFWWTRVQKGPTPD